jgi:hypothetical protein
MGTILLMIFISLHVIQAAHTHLESEAISKTTGGKSIQKGITRCPLCDYLLHKQFEGFHEAQSLSMNYFPGAPVVLASGHLSSIRAVLAQLWTNKGPPSFTVSA